MLLKQLALNRLVHHRYKMKINKETQALNDTLNKMDLIDGIGHSIQKQQNTLSSQLLMEHSQG